MLITVLDAFRIDILKSKAIITETVVLDIHKKLLSGIDDYNAGFYRNCPVRISGSRVILPNPIKVPDLMKEFWGKYKNSTKIEDIIKLHLDFVSIHPFSDGNGRCARLLMNLLLMQNGFCPIIIRPRDRKRYINSIEKAQLTGNIDDYMKFMVRRLSQSFDTIFDIYEPKKEVENAKLMTIAKFAKAVEVTCIDYQILGKSRKIKTDNVHRIRLYDVLSRTNQQSATLESKIGAILAYPKRCKETT